LSYVTGAEGPIFDDVMVVFVGVVVVVLCTVLSCARP
jgi:hypothetical protein